MALVAKPKSRRTSRQPVTSGNPELDEAILDAESSRIEEESVARAKKRAASKKKAAPKAPPAPQGSDDVGGDEGLPPVLRGQLMDWTELRKPISINGISKAFGMAPSTVKKRLAGVRPVDSWRGNDTYDFAEVMDYIATPQIDLAEQLSRMRPSEMPVLLQSPFWDAQNKRLDFGVKARHLWRTEDITEAFSSALQELRSSLLSLPDALRVEAQLSDAQSDKATAAVADILDTLRKNLVRHAQQNLAKSEARIMDDEAKKIEAKRLDANAAQGQEDD